MQLQYLTESNFAVVVTACKAYESQYVTLPSAEIVRAPMSTDAGYKQSCDGLRYTIYSLSDGAFTELLALAWTGRAAMSNSNWDYPNNLDLAMEHVSRDSADARTYFMGMAGPLRTYLENGLTNSHAVFRAG